MAGSRSVSISSGSSILGNILQYYPNARKTLSYITGIQQSSSMIFYYNKNQLARINIIKEKQSLQETIIPYSDIIDNITHVIFPFNFLIQRRKMNIYIIKTNNLDCLIETDWLKYELILFNMIQNSVKYAKHQDDNIWILLTCKPINKTDNSRKHSSKSDINRKSSSELSQFQEYMLETQIIDTGLGIKKEKQNLLFIPFLELRYLQEIKKTENDSIGLGLACSQTITKYLKGDIRLKESQRGLTVFTFKIPIKLSIINQANSRPQQLLCSSLIDLIGEENQQQFNQQQNQPNDIEINLLIGKIQPIPQKIDEYLMANSLQGVSDKFKQSQINKIFIREIEYAYISEASIDMNQRIQGMNNNNQIRPPINSNLQYSQIQSNPHRKLTVSSKHITQQVQEERINLNLNNLRKANCGSSQQNIELIANDDSSEHFILINNPKISPPTSQYQSADKIVQNQLEQINENESYISEGQSPQILNRLHPQEQQINLRDVIQPKNSNSKQNQTQNQQSSLNQNAFQNIQVQQQHDQFIIEEENKVQEKFDSNQSNSIQLNQQNNSISINNQIQQQQMQIINQMQNQRFRLNQHSLQNQIKNMNIEQINNLNRHQKIAITNNILSNNKNIRFFKLLQNNQQQQMIIQQDGLQNISKEQKCQIQDILVNDSEIINQISELNKIQQQIQNQQGEDIFDQDSDEMNWSQIHIRSDLQEFNSQLNQNENLIEQESYQHISQQNHVQVRLPNQSMGQPQQISSLIIDNNHQNNRDIPNQGLSVDKIDNSGYSLQESDPFSAIKRQQIKEESKQFENSGYELDDDSIFIKNRSIYKKQSICACENSILIVDDNDFNLQILRGIIEEQFSIIIEEATNGAIAVEKFKTRLNKACKCPNRTYKLIFMDIAMPIMNGIEATKQIKKLIHDENQNCNTKYKQSRNKYTDRSMTYNQSSKLSYRDYHKKSVITDENQKTIQCDILALTAFQTSEIKNQSLEAGASAFLTKPINSDTIKRVIKKYFYKLDEQLSGSSIQINHQ